MINMASIRRPLLAAGLLLAAALTSAQVLAQSAAPASAPAVSNAPRAEDTNAERARSQPLNNAPFWRGVRDSGNEPGITSLPGAEKGVLIQPFVQYPGTRYLTAGEAWRQVRNRFIIPYGGALLLITVLAIGLFYKAKGSIPLDAPETGRKIERFTYFERAAHWSNALAFVLLAVSGLVMMFGKATLLPVLGSTLFGWLAYALKNVHNFAGPLFAVSLLVMIFTFVRDNMPSGDDMNWLLKGGGVFGGGHVPSHRFNAGEKIIFWFGVFGLGLIVAGSGLFLDKLVLKYDRILVICIASSRSLIHENATKASFAILAGYKARRDRSEQHQRLGHRQSAAGPAQQPHRL